MECLNPLKCIGAGVLTFTLVTAPLSLPVLAQTSPTLAQATVEDDDLVEDDDFDWGWVGLIGLLGLAGLAGRNRRETTTYRDPNAPGSSYR